MLFICGLCSRTILMLVLGEQTDKLGGLRKCFIRVMISDGLILESKLFFIQWKACHGARGFGSDLQVYIILSMIHSNPDHSI